MANRVVMTGVALLVLVAWLVFAALARTAESDAEQSLQKRVDTQEKLVRDNPAVARYQGNLAKAYANLAEAQIDAGRREAGEVSYNKSISLLEKLVADNPAVAESQSSLARTYASLAVLQHRDDRLDDAIKTYAKAISAQEQLIKDNPAVPEHQQVLATISLYFGRAQRETHSLDEAAKTHRRVVEIWQELVVDQPDAAPNLAYAWSVYADTLGVAEKWQEAADAYAQAIKAKGDLRQFRSRRAVLLWAAGNKAEYQATCRDLIAEHGGTEDPIDAMYTAQVCVVGEDALADMSPVIELAQIAVTADPLDPVAKTVLGGAQFRAGKLDEAIATLKVSLPAHTAVSFLKPKLIDHLRLSRLLGECCLAWSYQKQGNQEGQEQCASNAREQLKLLEKSAAHPGVNLMPWSIPLSRTITNRELAKMGGAP